jgi:hypothetical protein
MSDMTGSEEIGPMPSLAGQQQSRYALPPTTTLKARTITDPSQIAQGVAKTPTLYQPLETTIEMVRRGGPPGGPKTAKKSVVKAAYTGQGLVDSKGVIARGQYDPDEAYRELASMTVTDRLAYLNDWYDRGLYPSGKPSVTGLESSDVGAMRQILLLSNSPDYGYTWQVTSNLLRTDFPGGKGAGAGRKITLTAPEDIGEYVKNASLKLLGRNPTKSEIDQAIKSIQGTERARKVAGEDVPSMGVLAEGQVQRVAGGEARVNAVASGIDIFRAMLAGARG